MFSCTRVLGRARVPIETLKANIFSYFQSFSYVCQFHLPLKISYHSFLSHLSLLKGGFNCWYSTGFCCLICITQFLPLLILSVDACSCLKERLQKRSSGWLGTWVTTSKYLLHFKFLYALGHGIPCMASFVPAAGRSSTP